MPMNEDETTPPPGSRDSEHEGSSMLLRVVGMASLVLCALTVYFAAAAEYLDETALAAADHALVRGLRVVAGACAVAGFIVGTWALTRRDEAIMRAQQAARDAQRPSV